MRTWPPGVQDGSRLGWSASELWITSREGRHLLAKLLASFYLQLNTIKTVAGVASMPTPAGRADETCFADVTLRC